MPSFLISRWHVQLQDPASHAETKLYFAFWAGAADAVEEAAEDLARCGGLRPHHLNDITFSLLELDEAARAIEVLRRLEGRVPLDGRGELTRSLCLAAIHAAMGDARRGEELLGACEPDPSNRTFNSARLAVARALFEAGGGSRALKPLRLVGPQDGFAREHLAWFHLAEGDAKQADRQLRQFLERDDHKTGRNLSNFLHGVSLIMAGRGDEAQRVFSLLPEASRPRTWTLGAHYAAGRLGGGTFDAYLEGSFYWERVNLKRQLELLFRARGVTDAQLLSSLAQRN